MRESLCVSFCACIRASAFVLYLKLGAWRSMAGVMQKFLVASMFMWMLPIAILYGFNNDLLPAWSLEVFELKKSTLELGALDLNPVRSHY
ncbi:hypothetical protein F2Q70_00008224 [Brassica cretica]|uniref:Uncharacterized protein n=1 Tax=Brassica cretica TaxID=69181 RepID=A0A8S9LYW2_BRACR|nr:hypothetical protein F2Q70_00008224 [Brassica cretica]